MRIATKLSENLLPKLEVADELWVAVGLINLDGLNFLLDNTQTNCTRNFLLGIDLPTDPKALHELNKLQLKPNLNVRLFTEGEFYHPKMYLVRINNSFSGFIGSANCTNGGLSKNIELTIQVDDQMICAELKSWFEARFVQGKRLISSFVETYRALYSERQRRQSEDAKVAMKLKQRNTARVSIKEIEEIVKIEMAQFAQRSGPSPIEEAWKIKLLRDNDYSRLEVMKEFSRPGRHKGKEGASASYAFINMRLSFLDFPKAIQEKIHDDRLRVKAAYLLHTHSWNKSPQEWQAILERAEAESRAKGKKEVRAKDIDDAAAWYNSRRP